MIGVDINSQSIQSALNNAAGQVAKASGQFAGVGVTLATTPTMADMAKAFEEATQGAAEKLKDYTKKVKSASSESQYRAEKIQELLEAVTNIDQRSKLDDLVRDLLNGDNRSLLALLRNLREFSQDKSEQYILLLALRQRLGKSGGNEIALQSINQAIQKLFAESGSEVRAGINSLIPAKEGEQAGLGHFSELRGFYQDSVLDYQGLSGTWSRIVDQYGESRFVLAASFMLKALSADLQAQGSSVDKTQLVSIMKDMNLIKSLAGSFDQCVKIGLIIEQGNSALPRKVMEQFLVLHDMTWIESEHIRHFLASLSVAQISRQIQVLIALKRAMALVPKELYEDPEQCQQGLDTIADVLDELTQQEEYDS